jgi:flagellar basal-body rod protein FlgF
MDRMIYTAMSGAKSMMQRQDVLANNLANVSTPGFRGETVAFRVAPVQGEGLATRAFVSESTPGADFSPGPISSTGRALDVALTSAGWLTVQGADGTEGYTRGGGLTLNDQGVLMTQTGLQVMGEGGPIAVPAGNSVAIASDGTVTGIPLSGAKTPIALGRLKLVNPPTNTMERGTDGLFRVKGGAPADADPAVRLATGSIEGSNVNAVEAMTGMISLARQYEMQMKLLQTAESNARKGTQILASNG